MESFRSVLLRKCNLTKKIRRRGAERGGARDCGKERTKGRGKRDEMKKSSRERGGDGKVELKMWDENYFDNTRSDGVPLIPKSSFYLLIRSQKFVEKLAADFSGHRSVPEGRNKQWGSSRRRRENARIRINGITLSEQIS